MTSETQPFVHLRLHSAYSLLEGALTIPKLAALAPAEGAPALALTDSNNLFGALEFSEALAETGIQPIIGLTLSLTFAAERDTAVASADVNAPRADGRIALRQGRRFDRAHRRARRAGRRGVRRRQS